MYVVARACFSVHIGIRFYFRGTKAWCSDHTPTDDGHAPYARAPKTERRSEASLCNNGLLFCVEAFAITKVSRLHGGVGENWLVEQKDSALLISNSTSERLLRVRWYFVRPCLLTPTSGGNKSHSQGQKWHFLLQDSWRIHAWRTVCPANVITAGHGTFPNTFPLEDIAKFHVQGMCRIGIGSPIYQVLDILGDGCRTHNLSACWNLHG